VGDNRKLFFTCIFHNTWGEIVVLVGGNILGCGILTWHLYSVLQCTFVPVFFARL